MADAQLRIPYPIRRDRMFTAIRTYQLNPFRGLTFFLLLSAISAGSFADQPSALQWGTYFGDINDENFSSMVLDSDGNPTIGGVTYSPAFPTTPGAFDTSHNGDSDGYIAKFDQVDGTLIFSTLFGGSGEDVIETVTSDAQGNIYVFGTTESADFPTTPGAFDTTYNGGRDLVLCKFDPSGSTLLLSTYLGGAHEDQVTYNNCIQVDSLGAIYVTGNTQSPDFPVTAGAFQTIKSGPAPGSNIARDAFVAKFSPDGSALEYATFIGGSLRENCLSLAVNNAGEAFICGLVNSTNFPVTAGAYQTIHGGAVDGFAVKLNSTGTALLYSTFLGGSGLDQAWGIALEQDGDAVVSGLAGNASFPTTPGAFSQIFAGVQDAFVLRLSSDGQALLASTFLGGEERDICLDIDIDPVGNILMGVETNSTLLPVTPDAFLSSYSGGIFDASVFKLSNDLSTLLYGSYVGGADEDNSAHVKAGDNGSIFLAVYGTTSSDFPVTAGAFDDTYNGDGTTYDVGIVKLNIGGDNQPPGIVCPEDVLVSCSLLDVVPVVFPDPVVSDNLPGVTVVCDPPSGSSFEVGTTIVNCTATDAAGNESTCSFAVIREPLEFDGFLPPIGGADATGGTFADPLRAFKLNSTIPVKFEATCDGEPVLTGTHVLQAIRYSSAATPDVPIDATPTDAATTGNEFRLSEGSQWHFNLSTKTGFSQGRWLLVVTLSDGSSHSAWITIKK